MIDAKIDLKELLELERMVNATNDDYTIAVSNIINLNLDVVLVKLLSKNIRPDKRRVFVEELGMSKNFYSYTFYDIYNEIKKDPDLINSELLKSYYIYSVKKLINESVEQLNLPLDDISIKIKWPKNANSN